MIAGQAVDPEIRARRKVHQMYRTIHFVSPALGVYCLMKVVRSSPFRFTLFSTLLGLAATPVFALDIWTREPIDGPGLWADGLNWSNGFPPNGTAAGNEEGRIDNNGTALVDDTQTDPFTGLTGEIKTGSLTLGSQPGASGNLIMSSGRFILQNTDLRIGGNPVVAIGG